MIDAVYITIGFALGLGLGVALAAPIITRLRSENFQLEETVKDLWNQFQQHDKTEN